MIQKAETVGLRAKPGKLKLISEAGHFSDAYANALLGSLVDGIVGFDRRRRITVWNRNMELHSNMKQADVQGRLLTEVVPELHDEEMFLEVLDGRNYFLKEQSYFTRQGSFQAYVSPVIENNIIIGGIAIIHDITEIREALDKISRQNKELSQANEELKEQIKIRKKAEAELQAAHDDLEKRVELRTAQLQAMNEELNEFAYVISHDLKAPLRGISSLSTWLLNDYSERLDDSGRHTLNMLKSTVSKMDQLIRGVLSYYRSGRPGEKKTIDTAVMVNDIINHISPGSHISISLRNLPVLVCEEVPLYQVFQNLIDNAIKYCNKPRCLIEIEAEQVNGYWEFAVRDNGCGIKPEDSERIFKLFQTGGQAGRTDSTGIGLSVVKKILSRIGGTIWIESSQDCGSCFKFRVPAKG